MKRISQVEARRLAKRVRELEAEEDRRRNTWADAWPAGTSLAAVSIDAEVMAAVLTARKLRHAVVALINSDGRLHLQAMPMGSRNA